MEKKFKIYTKTGDKGQTYTLGGVRVSKDDPKIEVYGEIDELMSWIGIILSHMNELPEGEEKEIIIQNLRIIQNRLFDTGTLVIGGKIDELEEWTLDLEKEIDRMDEKLPFLKSFILPGGSRLASFTHIARCVCRRVERRMVSLAKRQDFDENAVKYINRLSDYLFILARYINYLLGVEDVKRDTSIYIKKKIKIKPNKDKTRDQDSRNTQDGE